MYGTAFAMSAGAAMFSPSRASMNYGAELPLSRRRTAALCKIDGLQRDPKRSLPLGGSGRSTDVANRQAARTLANDKPCGGQSDWLHYQAASFLRPSRTGWQRIASLPRTALKPP